MKIFIYALALLGFQSHSVQGKVCDSEEFQCSNGNCTSFAWRCDEHDDCGDNSDEKGCEKKTCTDSFFRCDNGLCIATEWVCDGIPECADESDEKSSMCAEISCESFRCGNSNLCIPNSWRCDGTKDCSSGEDEEACTEITCNDDEFKCSESECISVEWRCNGQEDCEDGSDEKDCDKKCSADYFACGGDCISMLWVCDNDEDCKDGSDEVNCTAINNQHLTCDSKEFKCATPLNEAECIHIDWRCDGDYDCHDESDEENCDPRTCPSDEVMCEERQYCIKNILVCDGQVDCTDHSDERNCTYPVSCKSDEFDCFKNGSVCIPLTGKCNGIADCSNSADEAEVLKCPSSESNPCKENGGCDHDCIVNMSHPLGRVCACRQGFEQPIDSEVKCVDIDECAIPGSCSQLCNNTRGSYKCGCRKGYVLTIGKFCKAAEGQRAELFLTDMYDLRRYSLDTHHYTLLVENQELSGAIALDYDFRKRQVFWTAYKSRSIFTASLFSQEATQILSMEASHPGGLAVDWIHDNLYIADSGKHMIMVSRFDGSSLRTLVSDNLDVPRALALDPFRGWIYWTDSGYDPKIEKCGLNGKERKVIINKDIVWPNGLTIDYEDKRLYWVDAKMHYIGSSDLEGNDIKIVLKSHGQLAHPFSITVFEDFLYWSDWTDNAVHKIYKFGTGNLTTVAPNLKTPYETRVFHILRQPNSENYCPGKNGGCSHLCLPIPVIAGKEVTQKSECACPDDMVLNLDGRNCIQISAKAPSTFVPVTKKTIISTTKNAEEATTEKAEEATTEKAEEATTEKAEATTAEEATTEEISTTDSLNGTMKHTAGEKGVGHVVFIAIPVLVAFGVAMVLIAVLFMKRYRKKNVKSMNFDNPVYRKTTTEEQLIMDKDNARPNQPESLQPLNGDVIV